MESDEDTGAGSRSPPASPGGNGAPGLGESAADAEQVRALRSAIDAKLREQGIYEQVRELVRAKTSASHGAEPGEAPRAGEEDKENVLHQVLESEVVQRIVESVRATGAGAGDAQTGTTASGVAERGEVEPSASLGSHEDRGPGVHVLYLRLSGGRAFVDELAEDDDRAAPLEADAAQVGSVLAFFRLSVAFQQQRQCSRDVPCAVDPAFDEHFRFRVDGRAARGGSRALDVEVATPWEALCRVDEPVQIHLLKVVKTLLSRRPGAEPRWRELSTELVAVHRLDWRRALCSSLPMAHLPVQLVGAMKAPVGTLDLRADVLNCRRSARIAHAATALLGRLALEENARSHAFFKYAKHWWAEYRSETQGVDARRAGAAASGQCGGGGDREDEDARLLAYVAARPRLIKLFAEDEEGRYRMVCRFLTRLRAPAAIRTPGEAARFVSLLPLETRTLVGGTRDEAWRSLPTVLALKKGDALDHALLLASLLLGFGLDAFVCIGTVSSAADAATAAPSEVGHAWVLTRGSATAAAGSGRVLFWEAAAGDKVELSAASRRGAGRRGASGYRSVDCVFSDSQFFANAQPRAWPLAETSFALEDGAMWKRMDEELIAALPFAQMPVFLSPPAVGAAAGREQQWLAELRRDVTARRRANALLTRWSDELGHLLLPALNAYELERVYGVAQVENEFFQQSVTRFVPEGHTFQGVPLFFACAEVEEAVETAMRSDALVQQLVGLHARAARFGLAVRCFAYADGAFATWVMLAASYETAA